MNAFVLASVAGLLWVCILRTAFAKAVAVLIPVGLLFAAFQTMQLGINNLQSNSVDAFDKRLGTLRISFLGLEIPTKRDLQFGGEAATINASDAFVVPVYGAKVPLAAINADSMTVFNRLIGDRVVTVKMADSKSTLGAADAMAVDAIDSVPVTNGMVFCLAKSTSANCEQAPIFWQIDAERRLTAVVPGAAGIADRALACPIPTHHGMSNRIFPLATYGRPGCRGNKLEVLDHVSAVAPLIYLGYNPQGNLMLSVVKIDGSSGSASLLVHGTGFIGVAKKTISSVAQRVDAIDINILHFNIAEANTQHIQDDPLSSVEIGPSSLSRVLGYRLDAQDEANSATQLRRLTPHPPLSMESYSLSPSNNCIGRSVLALGSQSNSRATLEAKPSFLQDMMQIGAQGTQLVIERDTRAAHISSGCAGLGAAHLKVVGVNGVYEGGADSSQIAVGEVSLGRLLFSITETKMPIEHLLAVTLGIALIRMLLRLRFRTHYAQWSIQIIALVDFLLILRLIGAMQEITINPTEGSAVLNALLALSLGPLLLEAVVILRERVIATTTIWSDALHVRLMSLMSYRNSAVSTGTSWFASVLPHLRTNLGLYLCLLVPPIHLLAFFLGGVQESILGVRVSTLLVPLYAVTFAYFYFCVAPRNSNSKFLSKHSLGFLVWGVASVAAFLQVKDTGAILCLFPGLCLWMGWTVLNSAPVAAVPISKGGGALSFCLVLGMVLIPLITYAGLIFSIKGDAGSALMDIFQMDGSIGMYMAGTLVVAMVLAVSRARTALRITWLIPATLSVTLITIGAWGAIGQAQPNCPVEQAQKLAKCLATKSLEHNSLRIARLLAPQKGELEFSRDAIGMNQAFDELQWLTREWAGNAGRGFMTIAERHALNKYDNAFASHVIGPFGLHAAYFILAILSVMMIVAWRTHATGPQTFGAAISSSVLTVFCFSSIYVVLANLQWVFFTGRNVYLTTSISNSDLLEGFILIVIALLTCPRSAMPFAAVKVAT